MYIRFRSTDRFGHVTVKKRTQASNEKKKNNGSDRLDVTEDDFPFHLL